MYSERGIAPHEISVTYKGVAMDIKAVTTFRCDPIVENGTHVANVASMHIVARYPVCSPLTPHEHDGTWRDKPPLL
jgi:hypothetical protein